MCPLCAPGETPDLGFPDRMMARFLRRHPHGIIFWVVHQLEGQVFGLLVVGSRSPYASYAVTKVERRAIYSIDDGESWRQGVAESRRWIPYDEHA